MSSKIFATASPITLVLLFAALNVASDNAWKSRTERVGDIKIRYLEAGSGDRYLVFIPGWTMTAEIWREQIPYFAARGYHVVAYDPRSHGKTSKTDEGNTYAQHAADLHALLKTLNIEDVTLIGWSSGVTVLLDYMTSPESIRPDKMVLVDGSPKGLRSEDFPGGITVDQARRVGLGLQQDRKKFTDQFVRGMFRIRQAETLYKEITESSLKTPMGAAMALFFDGLTGDRRDALRRIRTPTLIIVTGDNRQVGEYMKSELRSSKLEVITDAGHALFMEKPQTFNQTVEAFLDEPW
jgi:pimeloyl-ACP methyl ester carboxylesterase